jgi:hypothetical protein
MRALAKATILIWVATAATSAGFALASTTPTALRPGRLPAGVYTVRRLIPGMRVTVPPGGWTSTEDSVGEFNLHPPGHPDASIFFWLDAHPTNCSDQLLPGTGTTPAAVIAWLRHNKNLIISAPRARTIGEGITATTVDLNVAATASSCSSSCPTPCIDYFLVRVGQTTIYFPYGTARGELVRLYFVSIKTPAHTLVIAIDTPNKQVFTSLTASATKILASLKLPARLPPGPR